MNSQFFYGKVWTDPSQIRHYHIICEIGVSMRICLGNGAFVDSIFVYCSILSLLFFISLKTMKLQVSLKFLV